MGKTDKFVELIKASGIVPETIFDIGAYDCAETLELAGAFPDAEVYAFEPVPKLAAQCDAVTRHNPKIHVIPVALSDDTELRTFYESTSNNQECGSLLPPNGEYFEPMPIREIFVPTMSARDIIKNLPMKSYEKRVVWMDAQGSEIAIINGFAHFIVDVEMVWSEVTYKPYYHFQPTVDRFDRIMQAHFGFEKIHEEVGIEGWFGNACYRKKK